MAGQSLNDRIALLGTSLTALSSQEATFEREKEAKNLYKKLQSLIDETREREKWVREHGNDPEDSRKMQETFEKLQEQIKMLRDVMGPAFEEMQKASKKRLSQSNFSSSFDADDPIIPQGQVRSRYGKSADFIGNLGGLFGNSRLQNLSSVLKGETDLTSGKMMKVAEKLNFAGKLLGGKNTSIGRKLLSGRDYFEKNKSFLSDYLSGKLNRDQNLNPYPGSLGRMRDQQRAASGQGIIGESFVEQESSRANPFTGSSPNSSRGNISRERQQGYDIVGKKISSVIKKFLAPEGFDEANARRVREMKRMNKIFGKLNKNMLKMDGTLGKFMGNLKDSLQGMLGGKKGWDGGVLGKAFRFFAGPGFGKKLGGIFKRGGGLLGKGLMRAVPMIGSAITGAAPLLGKALVAAGPALAVAFAGAAGLYIGNILNDKLTNWMENTESGKKFTNFVDTNWLSKKFQKVAFGVDRDEGGKAKENKAAADKVVEFTALRNKIVQPLGSGEHALTNTQQALLHQGMLEKDHLTEQQQQILQKEYGDNWEEHLKAIRDTGGSLTRANGGTGEYITGKEARDRRIAEGNAREYDTYTTEEVQAKVKEEQEILRAAKQTQVPQLGENITPPTTSTPTVMQTIGKGESKSYNTVNNSTSTGKEVANLQSMTIAEIMHKQDKKGGGYEFGAAGRHQFTRDTLQTAINNGIIKHDDKFDQATQDKLFGWRANENKAVLNYLTGESDDLEGAINGMGMTWSSVGMARDTERYDKKQNKTVQIKKGESYWSGVQGNKAHITPEEMMDPMREARRMTQELISQGVPPRQAAEMALTQANKMPQQSAPGEMKTQPQSEAARIAGLSEVGSNTGKVAPGSVADLNADRVALTKDAIARGVKYEWGGNSLQTGVDCSGFNSAINIEAMQRANERAGYEVYDMKKARAIWGNQKKGDRAVAAGIVQKLSQETGDLRELHKGAELKEGDVIGVRDERWTHAKDRWNEVGHVVQAVRDPKTGKLMIAESQTLGKNKQGKVTYTDAEKWQANQMRKGRQMWASNPQALANIKEDANVDFNKTQMVGDDGMQQEMMASTPPQINMPPHRDQGKSGEPRSGGVQSGSGPMGAGTQDALMTYMFGAYGYPGHYFMC